MTSDPSALAGFFPIDRLVFRASLDGEELSFPTVSGLGNEADGDTTKIVMKNPDDQTQISGTQINSTLSSTGSFYKWISAVNLDPNNVQRQNITIALVGQNGETHTTYFIANALPTELTSSACTSSINEGRMFVQMLEISAEKVQISFN